MNKRAAYQYVRAMSKAASVALRVKRAMEEDFGDASEKPELTPEDLRRLKSLYYEYMGQPALQDIALRQFRRVMELRNSSHQVAPSFKEMTYHD